MADDVKDIAIYTGSEWTSLSELTAGIVDAKLPIESVDGTVVVDGASSVFTVSTGGTAAFSLDANKYGRFTNHVGIASPAYSTAALALQSTINSANANGVFGIYQKNTFTCAADAAHANHAKVFSNNLAPADGNPFTTFMQFAGDCACGADVEQNFGLFVRAQGAKNNIGVCVSDGNKVADGDWAFYDSTGYPSYFKGQIQTPSVRGLAGNDSQITLDSNFTVSTGNAGQIRLEPGATSNNYLRVYDTGSPNGAMLCPRNSVSSGFILRPFKETVTGNAFSGFSLLWDYTASTVDFTNPAKNFAVSAYNAPSPACKGDRYYAFNVGGISSQTDFTLAAGLHLNVANNLAADKEAYNILVEGTAPSRFESELQTPSVRGLAGTDAQVTLGQQATLKAVDGSEYVPTNPASLATKKIVDDKIWVGTTAQYNAIATKNPTTLYCLTD
jgi:hypothetical protein